MTRMIWEEDPDLSAEARQQRAERKPNGHDPRKRIELVPFAEMRPNLTEADLVAGLLGTAQVSEIYGPPGCGKTFFALDIALRIAFGRKFRNRRVTKGMVVYIAAEAGRRIFNRVAAWRMRHMKDEEESEVPFYVVPCQLDLCNGIEDLEELIAVIREKGIPVLIVIDTLSRVMAGGNENSPEGMGAIISSADRLRDEFGANVCIIHHTGKDASRGSRGHSSLHAAVDTEIEVTRSEESGLSTATVVRQRDGEIGDKIYFELDVIELGVNGETHEIVTSCVITSPDPATVAELSKPKTKRSKAEQIALDALEIAIEREGEVPPADANCPAKRWVKEDVWRQRCYRAGISGGEMRAKQVAFQKACNALELQDVIGTQNGFAWIL
jgi:KaiC/GvpD/RAD55 family RecA-like ATPase